MPSNNPKNDKKYCEIYSWVVTEEIDYNSWMDKDIEHEHRKLMNTLYEINGELETFLSANSKQLERRLNAAAIRFKTEEKARSINNTIFRSRQNSREEIEYSNLMGSEKRKIIQEKEMLNNQTILKMCQK